MSSVDLKYCKSKHQNSLSLPNLDHPLINEEKINSEVSN